VLVAFIIRAMRKNLTIAVYFENHTKPINRRTLCGKNEELFIVKAGGTGTYIYHWALKG
jgi:hypothetical protein